jgi:hypothetical protein
MRFVLSSLLLVALSIVAKAQSKGEAVDWENAALFGASSVTINSDEINLRCEGCKIYEIKSTSGVTGVFLVGDGTFKVPGKDLAGQFNQCMVRFNPSQYTQLVTIEKKQKIQDENFKSDAKNTLAEVFQHCYNSGMDALIPDNASYACNFLTSKYGDLLVSYSPGKLAAYSYTLRKEY